MCSPTMQRRDRREEAQVQCYSGYVYPERPLSFVWEGEEWQVAAVEQAWQEPGFRLFIVRDSEDRRFRLSYQEMADRWTVAPVVY